MVMVTRWPAASTWIVRLCALMMVLEIGSGWGGFALHAAGTRDIDRLGGLGRTLPWTAALFTLGAVAICGLPPLNGFVSEFILYLGALRSLQIEGVGLVTIAAPILALIGALACACFVKVVGTVFLGQHRGDAEFTGHECAWSMRAPMLVLMPAAR